MDALAPIALLPPEDLAPECYGEDLTGKLNCIICMRMLNRPLQLSCGSIVCLQCCQNWVSSLSVTITCPCCYSDLDTRHITPPPPLIVSLLEGLLVCCVRKCGKVVRIDQYNRHLQGQCRSHYQQQLDSPSRMTIKEVLARPTTAPSTPSEVSLTEHLVRKMLDQGSSSSDGILQVKTRGQVCKLCVQHTNTL